MPIGFGLKRPTCDLDSATDGSDVCPQGCDSAAACTGTATQYSLSAACAGSSSESSCTATSADGTAGCCDQDIRTYHATTVAARGVPQSLTGWTTYDPRERAWYTEEMARAEDAGWSSVYVFSTSGELGVTRTAKMKRDSDTDPIGVLGVDFELSSISNILNATLSGTDNGWAFVVERSGDDAGLLLGSSFGTPLRGGSGERCYAHDTSTTSCPDLPETIAACARHLHAEGWRETEDGEVLTNAVPGHRGGNATAGLRYEVVSKHFTTDGLDWLIVVGQDIVCQDNERWVFGKCEDCTSGQVPRDDRVCLACGDTFIGTVSDEQVVGGLGTRCGCPVGSYSVGHHDPPICRPCTELNSRIVGVLDKYEDPIVWEGPGVCPGGIPVRSDLVELPRGRVCPLPKLWIETVVAPSEQLPRLALIACPSCVSAPCTNATAEQVHAQCKEHHTGFLCADCEPGYKLVDDECVECITTDWQWIGTEGFSAVLVGLFLMTKTWNCVAEPNDAEEVFEIMDTRGAGYLSGVDVRTLLIRMGNPVAAHSAFFDQTFAKMKGMKRKKRCETLREFLPRCCGGIPPPDTRWLDTHSVSKQEFRYVIHYCTTHARRCFFMQSDEFYQDELRTAAESSSNLSPLVHGLTGTGARCIRREL